MSKYECIYNEIVGKIVENIYPVGSKLPGELQLMKEYDASRATIRKALSLLAREGYIHKSQGLGSTVLDINRFKFPVSSIYSFSELAENLGDTVKSTVVCCEKIHPDGLIQEKLKVNAQDWVWFIQRVRNINGANVQLDTDILNAEIIQGITHEIASNSIYKHIEETLGLNISYAEKIITMQDKTALG